MNDPRFLRWFDRKTAIQLALFSGIFSLIVTAGLLWNGLRYQAPDVFDEKNFLALKEALKQDPNNPALMEVVRAEDYIRIRDYYRSRERLRFGAWMLFGGMFVFVFSMRRISALSAHLPQPLTPDQLKPSRRKPVLTMTALLAIPLPVALAAFFAFWWVSQMKKGSEAASLLLYPAAEDERWPQFRGPLGLGISPAMDLPLSWNAETGENILWKIPVPAPGNSSPIIWGDCLILTGGTPRERKVYCYNRLDGSPRWECAVDAGAILDAETLDEGETGVAAPTSLTDGRIIIAFFGTNELAGIDFEGNVVWTRWFGPPDSTYGIATSPIISDGSAYLQLDQGAADAGKSVLYALNPATGEIYWEKSRPVRDSWTSPIMASVDQHQELITAGDPWVIAYDPKSGTELWRANVLKGDVAPVPASASGMAFTVTEYSQLSAIRMGGSGDVTDSQVLWKYQGDLPDVASPLAEGVFLLQPTGIGTTHCFNAKTGDIFWTQEFDEGFWSSPVKIGPYVYLTDKEGTTFIFTLEEKYTEAGRGAVGETVFATPAFAGNRIYIRGKEHLFCIGKPL